MRKSKELPPPRIQGIWTTLIFFQVSWFFYVDRNKEQIEENISKISVRCDSFGAFLPHHRSRMNMVDFQFDSKVCNLKSGGGLTQRGYNSFFLVDCFKKSHHLNKKL